MTTMFIRRLDPDAASAYLALRLLALRESPTAFGTSYEEEVGLSLDEVRRALDTAFGWNLLGAFMGEALVGMARLDREESLKERHRASLRSMYVHPAHRRAGVGRVLVQEQLAVAHAMPGLQQITLSVTAGNAPAISLYESFGFTSYGVAPEALCVAGAYYDEVHMVRHLHTGSDSRPQP